MRNNTTSLIIALLLALLAGYIAAPIDHPEWLDRAVNWGGEGTRNLNEMKLGLDLQGGTQVLLESDLPEGAVIDEGDMATAKIIVENRVNGLGVSEAIVQQQGANRLIVELPGVENPDQAVQTIRATGQLEFVEPAGTPLRQNMVINTTNRPTAADELQAAQINGTALDLSLEPLPGQIFETVMRGTILQNAVAQPDEIGRYHINFVLTSEGSTEFFNYTSSHIGRPLPIVLDGRVLSAPTIQAAIQGNGVITGQFSQAEAESLAVQMRYGALPVPLRVVDVRTIGASLGQESVSNSLKAGIIGFLGVLAYMVIMYRVPGLLASVALALYVVFNLAIFKLVPITLTLAGIAGFVLSIGMAVDANILIFERTKEELRSGRSLRLAIEAGFTRAWPAIWDGNLSTVISCVVLYIFGNNFGASIVKGFAITLFLGVVLSMLTAVLVTRTLMRGFLINNSGSVEKSRAIIGY